MKTTLKNEEHVSGYGTCKSFTVNASDVSSDNRELVLAKPLCEVRSLILYLNLFFGLLFVSRL